jgi:hypothetical protein
MLIVLETHGEIGACRLGLLKAAPPARREAAGPEGLALTSPNRQADWHAWVLRTERAWRPFAVEGGAAMRAIFPTALTGLLMAASAQAAIRPGVYSNVCYFAEADDYGGYELQVRSDGAQPTVHGGCGDLQRGRQPV